MKVRMIGIVSALMLILTACSGTTESGGEVKVEEGIDAKEVFEKSIAAQEDIQYFHMNADMTQTLGSGEEEVEIKSVIESDMVMDPMAFHQMIEMTANGESMQAEQYFTEEGFFMKQGEQWMKLPDEMTDEMLTLQETQGDPAEQMEMLLEYVDEFTLTEEDGTYVMSLKASGEKFQGLMEKTAEEMGSQNQMMQEAMDQMKVNEVSYTYTVNKDSYLPVQLQMKMDSDMSMEGETVSTMMELDSTYDQYNEIEEVKVPAEVVEQAQEMPGMSE
ncbi:DUF6612 family protein [Guptibacillus hwajinpoensis]|uniref:DUF6612 family protein n=1 Tax=Guptibacillus hwajinpoensis TaxID=208199 RepID=UPI001CFC883D|nr:DUF6612 family protein [Pseudalkalibacillus hwajinpoensis]